MLVKSNKNEVKVVKLVTGEEVIGKIVEEGDFLTMNKPVVLVHTPDGNGYGMTRFVQLSEDDDVTISNNAVIAVCNVMSDIKDQYVTAFSNIQMPSKPSLII